MNNLSELINLNNFGPSKDEIPDFNKMLSGVKKDIFSKPLFSSCQICKKVGIKFCHSHTIPQFILKNIAEKGILYNTQVFNNTPFMDVENGIAKTQIFKSICAECDSKIFQEYENPNNWINMPSSNMLSQIALKDHLYYQYKLTRDLKMIEYANSQFAKMIGIKENKTPYYNLFQTWSLDKKDHARRVQKIYKSIEQNKNLFELGYYKKLPYVIPIVFQGTFAMYFDLKDRKINNPFTSKIDGLSNVYFCLYPFQDSSIIVVFHENNEKYKIFFEEFNNLDLDEQLSIINFLIFAYSEDIFISKNIDQSILNDINMQKTAFVQPISITKKSDAKNMQKARLDAFKKEYRIINHRQCPNLLSQRFSIQ